ncbi:hypothetical protein [Mycobacterium lehmannii]|uniref:hypothetical protein n=1 Tax=Mycobacterium lehmannii TaxID=2048550 RepID=UPI000B93B364|nr:hypothetical protein [Mycobacterium lehmannii]
MSSTPVGDLRRFLASVPALPGAACKGRGPLFDGETPADRIRAERLCRDACPSLGRCRRWVGSLSPSRRPTGVIAGKFREGRW